jgi:hypothetical protein
MSLLSKFKSQPAKTSPEPLFAVVFGSSGAGKSGSIGTFGLPTLVLRTPVESHGGVSASTISRKHFKTNNVVDIDITEGAKDSDEVLKNLAATLADPEVVKQFKVVVIDSLTDLQLNVIKTSKAFISKTRSDNGKENKLAMPRAYEEIFNDIINVQLKALSKQGVHVVMLAAAQIVTMGDDGAEVVAKPSLEGNVVNALISRSCPDVLMVNRVKNEAGEWEHSFIFQPKLSKEAKDLQGRITRSENFVPRVSYITDLPESCPADFKTLLAARLKHFKND